MSFFFPPPKIQQGRPPLQGFLINFQKEEKTVQNKEGLKELSHTTSKRAGETALQRSRRN